MTAKPRIAIPIIDQNVSNYTAALHAADMEGVAVSILEESDFREKCGTLTEYMNYRDFSAESFDGLLLPGGGDINPARLHEENLGSIGIRDDLDELQFSVLDLFVRSKRPVFGICRGLQIINVYFGGTLIQHLPTASRHTRGGDGPDLLHPCRAADGSWIRRLFGPEFTVNSAHHQAAGRPGASIAVDAICPEDGVIEALHHTSLPIYAVQWHPERACLRWKRDVLHDGLPAFHFFRSLIQ